MMKNRGYKSGAAGEPVAVVDRNALPEPPFHVSPFKGAVRRDETLVWLDPDMLPTRSSLILHRLGPQAEVRVLKPPPLPAPVSWAVREPVRRGILFLALAMAFAPSPPLVPLVALCMVAALGAAFESRDDRGARFTTVRLGGDAGVNSVVDAAEAIVRSPPGRRLLLVVDRPSQRFWVNEIASGTGVLSLACSRRADVRMVLVPSLWMLDDTPFSRLRSDCRRFWHGVHLAACGANLSDALHWVSFIHDEEGESPTLDSSSPSSLSSFSLADSEAACDDGLSSPSSLLSSSSSITGDGGSIVLTEAEVGDSSVRRRRTSLSASAAF
jgi:hypothetical protein